MLLGWQPPAIRRTYLITMYDARPPREPIADDRVIPLDGEKHSELARTWANGMLRRHKLRRASFVARWTERGEWKSMSFEATQRTLPRGFFGRLDA